MGIIIGILLLILSNTARRNSGGIFIPERKMIDSMKYRKKPVVVEAFRTDKDIVIHTLEGDMKANKGDYIITGVKGEQYPCKPDIFEQTYEAVIENN